MQKRMLSLVSGLPGEAVLRITARGSGQEHAQLISASGKLSNVLTSSNKCGNKRLLAFNPEVVETLESDGIVLFKY